MRKNDDCTLAIKHFPSELSDAEKLDFFQHLGAKEVKCLSSKYKKGNLIFARFQAPTTAKAVLFELHQKEFLGQLLNVQYARGEDLAKEASRLESENLPADKEGSDSKLYDQFLSKLNSWTKIVNFSQPPPVHLRYKYPEPNIIVLSNICKALYKIPKFYTQVLHLMNKMNLPCPFVDTYPIESDICVVDSIPIPQTADLSEDESELEDESPNVNAEVALQRPPRKRKRLRPTIKPKLTAQPVVRIQKAPSINPKEVFEVSEIQTKRIEVKLPTDLSSIQESKLEETVIEAKFEKIEPLNKTEETVEGKSDDVYSGKTITEEELAANRISKRDQRLLPVFKNYQPGNPSCRLYIKNLVKTVVENDLHFIYKRYYEEKDDAQGIMYDIRLMQEGRMKGQAFVTLQSVEAAQIALSETNGFILQGKPLVVAFARTAKSKTVDKPA